ncbi:NAD(P)H-binding protein [Streptomonospora halophila]|uniref:NAD(P)H-binding protein n=1 Tax=Streptomonospora halophila TaxID=427369 RepID=A0ABP9GLC0_9ACTN
MAAQSPILVTGATGNVGRHVVRRLSDEGRAVRALTRDPAKADLPAGVEAVQGDLADPGSLGPALEGVDTAFLVWPSVQADAAAAETVQAMAAGVERIAYLSTMGIDPERSEREGGILGSHAMLERLIKESGMSWTFVRAGGFAANLRDWIPRIRETGVIRMAYPNLARPLIHEADIAEVAVRALTESGHAGAAYEITGPAGITQAEQARIIGEELGAPVRVEAMTDDEAVRELTESGLPEEMARQILEAHARMVAHPEPATDTLERVTGAPPRTFRQWAADRVAAERAVAERVAGERAVAPGRDTRTRG